MWVGPGGGGRIEHLINKFLDLGLVVSVMFCILNSQSKHQILKLLLHSLPQVRFCLGFLIMIVQLHFLTLNLGSQ